VWRYELHSLFVSIYRLFAWPGGDSTRATARRQNERMSRPLIALLAWAGLIFLASSIPNPPGPQSREWHSELAHFIEYAVFGFLAARVFLQWRPNWQLVVLFLAAWLLTLAYGISDEWHQSFVPNRDPSLKDVLFDAVGGAAGVAVGLHFGALRRRLGRGS